jgi:thiamine kinase-like enzyme
VTRETWRIGIDFDNTLAKYDAVFLQAAHDAGFTNLSSTDLKIDIRNYLRSQPKGDLIWQKMQAKVYGRLMHDAEFFEGAAKFIQRCTAQNIKVFIVSHKTERAKHDFDGPNLRDMATEWMKAHDFFSEEGLGLKEGDIYFEPTRAEKISRIQALGCTHFIDDLKEFFSEENFPPGIKKFLFTPGQPNQDGSPFPSYASWSDIQDAVFADDIATIAAGLLSEPVQHVTPVEGGGNNALYRIETAHGSFALKQYRRNKNDPRDRYKIETSATSLMQENGFAKIPKFIAGDPSLKVAIFAWISGSHITNPSQENLTQAFDFIASLRHLNAAAKKNTNIQLASEACLAVNDIINQTKGRQVKLLAISDPNLQIFLTQEFSPALSEIEQWTKDQARIYDIDIKSKLPQNFLILSPSDFGFHNALETENGEIVFLDFEYFGWDDPTKLIADFILHPGMNLSDWAVTQVFDLTSGLFTEYPAFRQKLDLVIPLYALRWCMILLNKYLHNYDQLKSEEIAEQRLVQLGKARAMLATGLNYQRKAT